MSVDGKILWPLCYIMLLIDRAGSRPDASLAMRLAMKQKQLYHKRQIGSHQLTPQTLMMSYGYDPKLSEGAVKPPLFLSSTFVFATAEDGARFFDITSGRVRPGANEASGLVYSRFNNPNLEMLEDKIAL